jgi:hypothetical protein
MKLVIKPHRFTILFKYTIYEDSKAIFKAKQLLLSSPSQIDLFKKNSLLVGSVIRQDLLFPEFKIEFDGGFSTQCEGIRKPYNYLTAKDPDGIIEVHHQKGLTLAVFLE